MASLLHKVYQPRKSARLILDIVTGSYCGGLYPRCFIILREMTTQASARAHTQPSQVGAGSSVRGSALASVYFPSQCQRGRSRGNANAGRNGKHGLMRPR